MRRKFLMAIPGLLAVPAMMTAKGSAKQWFREQGCVTMGGHAWSREDGLTVNSGTPPYNAEIPIESCKRCGLLRLAR